MSTHFVQSFAEFKQSMTQALINLADKMAKIIKMVKVYAIVFGYNIKALDKMGMKINSFLPFHKNMVATYWNCLGKISMSTQNHSSR